MNTTTTLERTLKTFLAIKELDKPTATMYNGQLLRGVKSKHLTRSGVKYNRLLRLVRRLKQE
jgi:hypothetical protein